MMLTINSVVLHITDISALQIIAIVIINTNPDSNTTTISIPITALKPN